jgi:Recombination endonuclease VII
MTKEYAITKRYRDKLKAEDPERYMEMRQEQNKRWYEKHKEDAREKRRVYKKNKRASMSYEEKATEQLKQMFGITYEQKLSLLKDQGNVCAICGVANPFKDKVNNEGWVVDHCHKYEEETGGIKIRGILCRHCNWMLGNAHDSIQTLLNAAAYLQKHQ